MDPDVKNLHRLRKRSAEQRKVEERERYDAYFKFLNNSMYGKLDAASAYPEKELGPLERLGRFLSIRSRR